MSLFRFVPPISATVSCERNCTGPLDSKGPVPSIPTGARARTAAAAQHLSGLLRLGCCRADDGSPGHRPGGRPQCPAGGTDADRGDRPRGPLRADGLQHGPLAAPGRECQGRAHAPGHPGERDRRLRRRRDRSAGADPGRGPRAPEPARGDRLHPVAERRKPLHQKPWSNSLQRFLVGCFNAQFFCANRTS